MSNTDKLFELLDAGEFEQAKHFAAIYLASAYVHVDMSIYYVDREYSDHLVSLRLLHEVWRAVERSK
jgi:hypothetical protein